MYVLNVNGNSLTNTKIYGFDNLIKDAKCALLKAFMTLSNFTMLCRHKILALMQMIHICRGRLDNRHMLY